MKNWIFIFMISMITLPGYGKVKVQKPKMKHPTAFAILGISGSGKKGDCRPVAA